MDPSGTSRAEAERQVSAAAERYREAVASSEAPGRPEIGQQAALKALGRAVGLMSLVLKRAAATGVSEERLSELTAWEPERIRSELAETPEPPVAAAPEGLAAALRLHALTAEILADVADPVPGADVDDLHERLESAWRGWRLELDARSG